MTGVSHSHARFLRSRRNVPKPAVRLLSIAFGAAATGVLAQEHRTRQQAERLAAALLETLLNAIDANDHQTGAHVRRVARYALILADAADLPEADQRSVERVALFHDIGKIDEALFDIIHDGNRLTDAECAAIATHPARGAQVLEPLAAFYPDLAEGVLAHHERWDGKGYPRGLRGTGIPLAARIVAIADTYDAVTHSRRYRSGKDVQVGAQVIAEGAGTQFDPDLADLFLCPPVFTCVKDAMRESTRVTKRVPGDRRRGSQPTAVPDIPFRWRAEIGGGQVRSDTDDVQGIRHGGAAEGADTRDQR